MTLVAPVILVRPMNLAALGVLLIPVRSVTLGSSDDPSVPRASGGLVTLVTPLSPVALVAQVILLSPADLVTLTALADPSGSDGLGDPGGLNGPAELPGPHEPGDPRDPGVHGAPSPPRVVSRQNPRCPSRPCPAPAARAGTLRPRPWWTGRSTGGRS